MTLAKISLASTAAITIISWGAWAQENQIPVYLDKTDILRVRRHVSKAPTNRHRLPLIQLSRMNV
jgi:hypothetical protein